MFKQNSYFRILTVVLGIFMGLGILHGQNYTPLPGSPLANHEHPRIFFTDDMLQSVISPYIINYESADFQTFINTLDGHFSDSPSSKTRNYLLLDTKSYAFLSYAVHSGYFNSFSFGHTAAQYAAKAYEHALEVESKIRSGSLNDNHNSPNFTSDSEGGYVNLTPAVVYDWCFDYLTQAQKEQIADLLIYQYDNRDNETYPGGKTKLDNNRIAFAHAGASGALAIWGDNLGGNRVNKAQDMMNMIQEIWIDRIWKMADHAFERAAGWGEGCSYFFLSHKSAIWFTAAASSAFGQNLFKEYKWLHDAPLFMWFYKFPSFVNGEWQNYFVHRSDDGSLWNWDDNYTREFVHAIVANIKLQDPDSAGFYKWMVEDSHYPVGENGISDIRLYWLFYKFLWGIKDVSKKDYQQVGIKNSYRFALGDAVFQSAHNDTTATQVQFFTPKYFQRSHAHSDGASLNIWKYGTLLLDGWNSKSGFDLPKADATGRPIAHNVLALYPSGGDPTYPYYYGINEGADSWYHPDNQPGGKNHVGDVLAIDLEGNNYDFIDYDYTRSYKGTNFVNHARRAVIYLRNTSGSQNNEEYVLVYDKVNVTDPTIKKRWLGHFAFRPVNVDGSWNQQAPGFWTDTQGSILEVSNTYANAHGRLFLKVLEPNNYQLRLRGGDDGSNYYWFVDAEGNDLTERGPFDDWAAFWVGSYRVEIEDLANSNISHYLVAMQIGDANTLNSMVSVEKIETGSFLGALINKDRVAFFNKSDSPAANIGYNFTSNKMVKHLITGLEQGLYFVKVDGNLISGINTFVGENGVLYFEYQGGGNFVISKSGDTIPPQNPQGIEIQP
ncbi:MAG: hypothetical protein Kow0042_25410 [Calditrichia bacterium]